ncbi:MAG: FG-GAP repeat domain-containing protein, partial [Segetibacter sp.]
MKNKKSIFSISFKLIICVGIFLSCNSPENTNNSETSSSTITGNNNTLLQQGKALAAQHCQGCHELPDPSLLDKENWQKALAMMAPRLGIYSHNGKRYQIFTDIDQSFYPEKPFMNSLDWQTIIDYYTEFASPVMQPPVRTKPIKKGLPFFSLIFPGQLFFREGNTASFIKIDTVEKPHRIFVNRANSNTLFMLDGDLQLQDSLITNGTVVDIDFNRNKLLACTIGDNLFGNNSKAGSLIPVEIKNGRISSNVRPLVDTLARPLNITPVDINGDGKKDYLVCEFGNLTGSLLWMENTGNSHFARHNIRSLPGATKACVQDFNHDGRPDIWALFAQGEEGIFLFTNKGNGSFTEKQLLRFPPSYGSTSFELDDFNHDGFSDIVYTCGDR